MPAKIMFAFVCLFIACRCHAQTKPPPALTDTTFDYTELLSELDALIDSLSAPRSFAVFSVSAARGAFNFDNKTSFVSEEKKKLTYAPSLGYYHKSGLGVSADAALVNDGNKLNAYQLSAAASYDYIQNRRLITGLSITHFFTKKNLPFYTSPLQNELYGYFTYRKLWFKPSVSVSYGKGSRKAYEEREEQIQNIQLADRGFTRINTRESVVDVALTAAVRHDFYFLKLLSATDYLRITPQLAFTSGTQQFGFNQSSSSYATIRRTGRNVLYNTENISLDNRLYFQPISLTMYLKTEYSIGHFFIQPQALFDYYFPAATDNFTTGFVLNAGVVF